MSPPGPVMAGSDPGLALDLRTADLGRLMPMFLVLDRRGIIQSCGPTLRRILTDAPMGHRLDHAFEMIHPTAFDDPGGLLGPEPVRLRLRGPARTVLRGAAMPLASAGVLLNLSLGGDLHEAVRLHELSDSDFAPTDLAFDLLYLSEANAAVIAEARKFSARLREARAQALEQALSDPLTGLWNRRGLDGALERLARGDESFGLIHLDLDHFKQINDSLGHAAGDRVLVAVAARLRSAIRDGDIAARIGGDEFVVVVGGAPDNRLMGEIARRLLGAIVRPVPADRRIDPRAPPIRISASLGVSIRQAGEPVCVEELLQRADRALYRSKEAGRGRVSFDAAS